MIEELVRDALSATEDARKFDRGNTAAGKRTRKQMQIVRTAAKQIRVEIQDIRDERRYAKAKEEGRNVKLSEVG
jgi:hypothetical protein